MRFEYQSSWFTMGLRPSSNSKMSGHAVPQCQQRYVLCEKWCLSLFSELDMHMCSSAGSFASRGQKSNSNLSYICVT